MPPLTLHQKRQLILDHETIMAEQLGVRVLDKPKPPLWMIFIPIFFVFFAQKMHQYRRGREEFVRNYLISRRRALDAALVALETNAPIDVPAIVALAADIPDTARPAYTAWVTALAEHFQRILQARGANYADLVRTAYASKTNYLLFCNQLNQLEHAFTLAVVPRVQGDDADVHAVIHTMHEAVTALRRDQANILFP